MPVGVHAYKMHDIRYTPMTYTSVTGVHLIDVYLKAFRFFNLDF
jgi:hypothetical protein